MITKTPALIYTIAATLLVLLVSSCDPKEVEAEKSNLELISQNGWKLDQFTSIDGTVLQNSDLDQGAILLFVMNFEFLSSGEVRGVDKASNNIIERGVWEFINNETAIVVDLTNFNYEFQVLELKAGRLVLQAPTGNFLSGVGERINLEFSASN